MIRIIRSSLINRHCVNAVLRNTFGIIRPISSHQCFRYSTQTAVNDDIHCIIKDKEKTKGKLETQEFKAETKKLLDIVAKSLYSDKEVFVRELVSNASDALEKLRYLRTSGLQLSPIDDVLEIHIKTEENKNQLIIQDTGVGMTKEEMISNLGTIARSGSLEFIDKIKSENINDNSIIGKFGVGFYSSFMVADTVEVFSRPFNSTHGYHWRSVGGLGSFEVCEADDVDSGTKIILHLKKDSSEFSDETKVEKIVSKYSSYVASPVFLNGRKLRMVQPLWQKDHAAISDQDHERFYQFISGNINDTPRYTIPFKTDVPIDIKALFYVPALRPSLYEIAREHDAGVSLYSRKIMIMNRTQKLLPSWLRFLKGVVESDDIPLNLSRELLQDSALISKINRVITGKIVKYFLDQANKDRTKYGKFYHEFGLYLKEGIINTHDQTEKESIAKLLRFETNKLAAGELSSLAEYSERMKAGSRKIYFFSAPNRSIAESSPYMEAMNAKDIEIIYLYEPYDEVVVMQLGRFDNKQLCSVENDLSEDAANVGTVDATNTASLTQTEAEEITTWIEQQLKPKISKAKVTQRLTSHPCVLSIKDMGAVRYFLRTSLNDRSEEEKYTLMNATLELNPSHVLIKKLASLHKSDEKLAKLLVDQLFDNAMVLAGMVTDSRDIVTRVNTLLTEVFAKM